MTASLCLSLHKDSASTGSRSVFIEPAVTIIPVEKSFLAVVEPKIADQSATADVFHLTASQR
jgi:hypothetical protein